MNAIAYPRLIKRVRAVLIDSVLVPASVFATLILGDAMGVTHTLGKTLLLLAPIFILEPVLVSVSGGTVGHHLQGIRITRLDGRTNINLFAATIRFVLKVVLGWLSLIFVLTSAKHQAAHDVVARSMVIHKNTAGLPAYEVLAERTLETSTYTYPPSWRRVIVIVAYAIAATFALGVATVIVSSSACVGRNSCTTADELFKIVLELCWIVGIGWLSVRGWNGMLYGCRRRKIS